MTTINSFSPAVAGALATVYGGGKSADYQRGYAHALMGEPMEDQEADYYVGFADSMEELEATAPACFAALME